MTRTETSCFLKAIDEKMNLNEFMAKKAWCSGAPPYAFIY